jgi:hypothetical protein
MPSSVVPLMHLALIFQVESFVTIQRSFNSPLVRPFPGGFELKSSSPYNNQDLGLLRGINVTAAQYYSSDLKMDSVGDVKWLGELGLPYQAAIKDAKEQGITVDDYLTKVADAATTFIKSGAVHDREEFYEFLEGAVNTSKGQFCLILGGKSFGKSLVLADFAKKNLSTTKKSRSCCWMLEDPRDRRSQL